MKKRSTIIAGVVAVAVMAGFTGCSGGDADKKDSKK